MKQLETLEKQESGRIRSVRKKADKPWVLQRKWQSQADFKKYHFNPVGDFTSEWEDAFDKYMSPKHARQQIEKQLRTHFHARFRNGRDWRIINKTTTQSLLIEFVDGKVIIDETKGNISSGLSTALEVNNSSTGSVINKKLEEMSPQELIELGKRLAALQQINDKATS